MTTKEYLSQVSRLNRMIQNKISEISQLRELECSVAGMQGPERSGAEAYGGRGGASYAMIEEMEHKLGQAVEEYVHKREAIISQIESMEDEISYDILFARYIEKKTLEGIAESLHYSFRQITRLHGKALQEFEEKYGNRYLEEESLSHMS
jgi:hypothetical protein